MVFEAAPLSSALGTLIGTSRPRWIAVDWSDLGRRFIKKYRAAQPHSAQAPIMRSSNAILLLQLPFVAEEPVERSQAELVASYFRD
jgi:hypothetical protein